MRGRSKIEIGDVFKNSSGLDYEVLSYDDSKSITIRFIKTGFIRNTSVARITDGVVKDFLSPSVFGVGCIGSGKYSKTTHPEAYQKWKDMLCRCYSEKYQKRQPTYIGCSVCNEWLNFQNFSAWLYENVSDCLADVQLDKDIKISGNKVYSPSACSLVSHKTNSEASHAKEYLFLSPSGNITKVFNLHEFCSENGLHHGHMSCVNSGARSSHKGWRSAR